LNRIFVEIGGHIIFKNPFDYKTEKNKFIEAEAMIKRYLRDLFIKKIPSEREIPEDIFFEKVWIHHHYKESPQNYVDMFEHYKKLVLNARN
jgi:hypothetical protein